MEFLPLARFTFTVIAEVRSCCTEMTKDRSTFKARRVFSFVFVQSDSFLCQPTDEHNRETFACESDHSRLATIILDVPVAVENLIVV